MAIEINEVMRSFGVVLEPKNGDNSGTDATESVGNFVLDSSTPEMRSCAEEVSCALLDLHHIGLPYNCVDNLSHYVTCVETTIADMMRFKDEGKRIDKNNFTKLCMDLNSSGKLSAETIDAFASFHGYAILRNEKNKMIGIEHYPIDIKSYYIKA